jgi:hypothetical protein
MEGEAYTKRLGTAYRSLMTMTFDTRRVYATAKVMRRRILVIVGMMAWL